MFDKQTKKFCSAVVDALPDVSEEVMQGWIGNPQSLKRTLKTALCPHEESATNTPVSQTDSVFLRLLSAGQSIIVGATDGQETLADATDVFRSFIDPDFKNWGCDVVSGPTPETGAEVYELVRDGNFGQFFPSLGRPLDQLCWAPSQIKHFCRDHENWLRTDGYGTTFLFKVGDEYFVASVDRDGARGLRVVVFRFSYNGVWRGDGRNRVVVPQLTTVPSGT